MLLALTLCPVNNRLLRPNQRPDHIDQFVEVFHLQHLGQYRFHRDQDAVGLIECLVEYLVGGGVAANSLGAPRIGRLCYDIAKAQGIKVITVADEAITQAQALLWSSARVLAEPGGATALAALTSGRFVTPTGARVGVVVCGGNIDPSPV